MEYMISKSVRRFVTATAVPFALLLAAGTASAQRNGQQPQRYPQSQGNQQARNGGQQELFEWQGRVDREIRIQMTGGRTSVQLVGNNEHTNTRVRAVGSVPNQDGIVTVQQLEGRGKVDVVQQPTRGNGYTTIIRLRDPNSGAANYRVAAYWQPTGNSNMNRNGRHGNPNGNNGDYGNGGYGQNRDHRN